MPPARRPEAAPPADGRSLRWASHRERRREEFVEAALEAIRTHGPQATPEQIAEHAGVSRTKIYRHFDGFAGLQHAVARHVIARIADDVERAWYGRDTPIGVVTSVIRLYVDFMVEHGNVFRFVARSSLESRVADRSTSEHPLVDLRSAVATKLARLFDDRLTFLGIDPIPAAPLAFSVVGLVESATYRWIEARDESMESLVEHLAHWVWVLIDDTLRRGGVELDPETPLGDLFAGVDPAL